MTEVVELYVVMHCEACEASVRRAIRKIPGLESYKIDFYGQKVTVTGKVDREDVWRRIHKTGKRVALIPKPVPPPKKEEKKEGKKEAEKKQEKEGEKKEDKTEEPKKAVETVLVRKKSTYWPAVWLWRSFIPRGVKVHEKRDEGVTTVVEVKENKKEEVQAEEKSEAKEETQGKKETSEEPEWVPMFVSAPFYTLPTQIFLHS